MREPVFAGSSPASKCSEPRAEDTLTIRGASDLDKRGIKASRKEEAQSFSI